MLGEHLFPCRNRQSRAARSVRGRSIWSAPGRAIPWLLTRKGEAVLSRADVVVYDHLASSRLLDLARHDAVRVLAGKSVGHCILTQEEINELLIGNARAGRIVVRLKGGDPLVFGRGGEEASCLRAGGDSVRDRAGRDRGAGRHGVRRHPGHAPRGGLGRGIRDRSRRSGTRARAESARLVGAGAVSRARWSSTWESLISRRFAAP